MASRHFDGGVNQARREILEDGAGKACAGQRRDPLLTAANRTVQKWRNELPALMRSLKPIE